MAYRYYCPFRPPMLGAVPRGFCGMEDFGERRELPEIGQEAWGWVEYENPLTDEQIRSYELAMAHGKRKEPDATPGTWKHAKVHDISIRFGGCIDEFRGFDDDRLIYINIYEQIMEALEQLPDNPVGYLRVAMWRQIKRDIPLLEGIQGRFC